MSKQRETLEDGLWNLHDANLGANMASRDWGCK